MIQIALSQPGISVSLAGGRSLLSATQPRKVLRSADNAEDPKGIHAVSLIRRSGPNGRGDIKESVQVLDRFGPGAMSVTPGLQPFS